MSTVTCPAVTPSRTALPRAAVVLAGLAAAFQLLNVARAVVDPAAFASYLGLPLAAAADDRLVLVYASRTAFVAAVAIILLARRQFRVLALVAGFAVILPISDAVLARDAGASGATVARHLAIAGYLAVTSAVLWRARGNDA